MASFHAYQESNPATDSIRRRRGLDAGRPASTRQPFSWQNGARLLLLDEEEGLWLFAELEFDQVSCRYVEVRRASYTWQREALGALVARAYVSGADAASDAAESLQNWYGECNEPDEHEYGSAVPMPGFDLVN